MNLRELDEIIDWVLRLSSVIRNVRNRIESGRLPYQSNETTTRYQLIDPVLDELGWDVRDNDLVVPEYSINKGRVDYALMDNGNPIAVVEAKNLSRTLDDDVVVQVLNYIADQPTIRYAIATNGDSWQMRVKGERNKAVDLMITDRSEYQVALELMRMSRLILQPDEEKIVAPPPQKPQNLVVARENRPRPGSRSISPTPPHRNFGGPVHDDPTGWVSITSVSGLNKSRPLPNAIRFPDGSTERISYGIDVFRSVATWLVDGDRLTPDNAQVYRPDDSTVYCCASYPQHPTGRDFKNVQRIGNVDVYIEKDMGIQLSVDSACALLRHCGVEPSTVQLRF